jgi:ornithine cyclodeaminase/alanine dehydrogenase
MTKTRTPPAAVPFLSHEEIVDLDLPLGEVVEAVEAAFREHGRGAVEMPPKVGVHTRPGTFLHAMPAWIPGLQACGMKWVSGYPDNQARGLPTIAGLVILNDPETGLPRAMLDARWITAERTGIVSALVARSCASPEARTLAIAGCGVQGRAHARAFLHVLPGIEEVRLYDVREESARDLREELGATYPGRIEIARSPENCLRGAEIAATCTSGRTLNVEDHWLPPGGTAVGVDSHIAWGKLIRTVDKFVIDDERQAREFDKMGKYPGGLPQVHAELGQMLAGLRPGRESRLERILGLPLGLAIADIAVASLLLRRSLERSG